MCAQAAWALAAGRSCEQTIPRLLSEERKEGGLDPPNAAAARPARHSTGGCRRPLRACTLRLGVPVANSNGRPEPLVITAQLAAAERLASAIVFAFDVCEEGGVPLSQAQKIAVVEAALLEFDGFEASLESLTSVAALIRELGGHEQRD
jgi:hypothetical protein